ncbi:hypothetical protein ACNI3Q_09470 [Sphingomonas sp. FW199]|uniref:hypothetical protein n=1 Tax=Sphingomonas sp. FW199 TaxID=3400217 RepID=UPI003CF491D9
MAVRGFRGLGWLGGAVVVALGCNMVSSRVDAERQRLVALDKAIAATQNDIRMLEAEFMTRANTAQLEKWNGEMMRLSVPAAGQFLVGETALAQLDQPGAPTDRQFAGYIVPEAVPELAMPQPVEASTTEKPAPRPAAPPAAVQTVAATAPVKPRPIAPADTVKVKSVTISAERTAKRGSPRAQAVEKRLLRETSFNDLLRGSDAGGSTLQ